MDHENLNKSNANINEFKFRRLIFLSNPDKIFLQDAKSFLNQHCNSKIG